MSLGGPLALAAYVAFTPPQVRGTGDCPSAAEVTARLTPLLPRQGSGEASSDALSDPGDEVELATVDGAIVAKLRDPNGDVVHQRVTAATACADRATEIAVLVAIWEADLHSDVAFPAIAGAAEEVPSKEPAAPSAPALAVAQAVDPPRASPAPGPSELSLGAALSFVAPPSQGVVPAGWIEATWKRGLPVRARLALSASGTHEIELSPGTVSWRRVSLGLGAMADLGRGRARASLRAGAVLGALISRGSGFSFDQSATSWQLGADAGLRGGFALTPRVVAWAEAGLAGFPGTQRLAVLNVSEQRAVPRWEAFAGLGASFSWSP